MLTIGAEPAGPAVESGLRGQERKKGGGERSAPAGRAAMGALYIAGLRHWLLRGLAATARERSHPLCTPVR